MQISSRFTMAIHMFACIDAFSDQKMTSDFMAASIGTNPVIIRKLLQQLLDEARQQGIYRIYLEVRDSNAAAITLYKHAGFKEVGKRKNYYEHGFIHIYFPSFCESHQCAMKRIGYLHFLFLFPSDMMVP